MKTELWQPKTRVSLADSSGTKVFRRDGVGVTAPVLGDGAANFSPGVSENRAGVKTYFHHALKNTDAQTNAAQAVVATREYDAFGSVVSSSGPWASQFGNAGRFGYQEDPGSGLRLLGHRYYDSSTGRFLTRDPAKDGRNWYGYCGNDPVGAVDPEGLKWHDPMTIYVDEDFDGYVLVSGEPGPGMEQGYVRVNPGYHSNPLMDADYLLVFESDNAFGREYFPWGGEWDHDGKEVQQFGTVDRDGNLHTTGPVSDPFGLTYGLPWGLGWGARHRKARDNDLTDIAPPRKGFPKLPRLGKRRSSPENGADVSTPAGAVVLRDRDIVWE